jgi:hypothetical protein
MRRSLTVSHGERLAAFACQYKTAKLQSIRTISHARRYICGSGQTKAAVPQTGTAAFSAFLLLLQRPLSLFPGNDLAYGIAVAGRL